LKPDALTIAGSDPTGGAGIQSDLRTFNRLGVRGYSVVTALTAQNSKGVFHVQPAGRESVRAQLHTLFEDAIPSAVKVGMLCNGDTVREVFDQLSRLSGNIPVVLDPVVLSSSGYPLLDREGVEILLDGLIPRVTVLTPNIPEARFLLGLEREVGGEELAGMAGKLGARYTLLKGGHGRGDASVDFLSWQGRVKAFSSPRRKGVDLHGSGCRLSSAITAFLAQGDDVETAVGKAKVYMDKIFKLSRRSGGKEIIF